MFFSTAASRAFFPRADRGLGRRMGLTGWIRNLSDGRVEVVAEGRREDLETLLGLLRQGPSFARVDAATSAGWIIRGNRCLPDPPDGSLGPPGPLPFFQDFCRQSLEQKKYSRPSTTSRRASLRADRSGRIRP